MAILVSDRKGIKRKNNIKKISNMCVCVFVQKTCNNSKPIYNK